MIRFAVPALFALQLIACGGISRSYEEPKPSELLSYLLGLQEHAHSFDAESRMEYWVNGERIKTTVYVMGEKGAKVRFNALDPTDNVAADLACDGVNFQFVDFDKNCQLTGPCSKDAISQLLRVSLAPDDFLMLAVGSTPLIDRPTGTVRWDKDKGHEILSLTSADGHWKQRIVLDGKKKTWDVLQSTVWNSDGKKEWILQNSDFKKVEAKDGKEFRVPFRTKFEQPKAKAELSVRWVDRALNPELDDSKFTMQMPAGLPRCP
jgi:hypothetical protein